MFEIIIVSSKYFHTNIFADGWLKMIQIFFKLNKHKLINIK